MQQSTLDMAQRLKQTDLRKIALEVSALSFTPFPPPLSLQAILKAFARIAKPEIPEAVNVKLAYNPETLTPIYGATFTWRDPGAHSLRSASRYRCRFSDEYGGPVQKDVWTTNRSADLNWSLAFDTDYKAGVMAYNPYGRSEWRWMKFHTYDNPNPAPGPGPSPGPQPQPHNPSAIYFYNCDETPPPAGGTDEHLPVHLWLEDLTAGTGPQDMGEVAAGYNEAGTCGPGYTDPQMYPLVNGHQYQWVVVKPDDPYCTGGNDPNGDCVVLGPASIVGGDGDPAIIQYGP